MTPTSCWLAHQERPIRTVWHRGLHDPTVPPDASAFSECIQHLRTSHQDPILFL